MYVYINMYIYYIYMYGLNNQILRLAPSLEHTYQNFPAACVKTCPSSSSCKSDSVSFSNVPGRLKMMD